jgi:hypothetical protein
MAVRRARPPRRPGAGLPWLRTPRGLIPWLALPTAGVAAGVAIIVAALLPWYGTNLGSPFTPSTTSGWSAGPAGKAVLALGAAVTLVSLFLAADQAGALGLDGGLRRALRLALIGASALAAALACYRLLVLPRPSGFFSREVGLYLALAAGSAGAMVGALAGDRPESEEPRQPPRG